MEKVLITGANRGLGFELTKQFVLRGDRVYACCRNPESAESLQDLQATHPKRVLILKIDVMSRRAVRQAAREVLKSTASLDILVNNAGIGTRDQLADVTPDDLVASFQTNAAGPLIVAQSFLPMLKKGKNPRIINITSRMGSIKDNSSGGYYSYRASKAALNMITRSLAVDLADTGIIVAALSPGWVKTDMGGNAAPLPIGKSVRGLLKVIAGLNRVASGHFLAWNGEQLPW